ncbi:MAG: cellulase family glycosylhydrolase, partial [Spirochaetales bacterium]|nr:cellulase family glycosylhydrolase [Spirochaetales bacterium]
MINVNKKAILVFFLFIVFSFSAITQDWRVEYKVPDLNADTNTIMANFRIINNSGTGVPWSELSLRYWYTREGSSDESFSCWYAEIGLEKVVGFFGDVVGTEADRYLEIGFIDGTGTMQSGATSGEIQCGWHKSDWSVYDETDDYSYDETKQSYASWDHITLYLNGTLVWGIEPDAGPTPDPTDTPAPTDTPEPTSVPTETPDPTPEPTAGPTGDGSGIGILLEAEDFVAFYDTTSGNEGSTYRDYDVDIESCSEGGYNVGWIVANEWLEYSITIPENDIFDIYVRVASPQIITDGFYIEINNIDVTGMVDIPNTGAWQSWADVFIPGVALSSGTYRLRIIFNGEFNFNFIYLASQTNPPDPTEIPGAEPTSTPPPDYIGIVEQYGQLQVNGTSLCDQNGNPVQLKGMCSHGLQWFPFMAGHTIPNLAYDWNISIIRPAMYIEDYKNGDYWGGYIVQPEYMKEKLEEMIVDALDVGIYVIIDWHIHNDPLNFVTEALDFYTEMATKYGNYPNIVYEICNEPENVSWQVVKTYANQVIPVIRQIDPDNIIIVGTPTWCQDLYSPADAPLTGYTNIMYTLHFYAGSHGQSIRDSADYALNNGIPVIVSEWGTSDHTGGSDGVVYLNEAQVWLNWMNDRNLSWINWNFSNKSESSAALLAGVNIGGPWPDSVLSESGKYIKSKMISDPIPTSTPDPTPEPTAGPTADPTPEPTAEPTVDPTPEPTAGATVVPTA